MKKLMVLVSCIPYLLHASGYEIVERNILHGLSSLKSGTQIISDCDKYRTALRILKSAAQSAQYPHTQPLNDTTIGDLSLLFYDVSKPDFTILNRIKRTQTTLGTCELAHMLITPLTDHTQLRRRQDIITTLINNDHLRTTLRTVLDHLATHEDQLLALWNPEDRLYGKNMQQAFFAGNMQTAIRDKFILEFRSRYDDFIPTVTFLAAFLVLYFKERISSKPETWWEKNVRARIKYLPLLGSVISISNYLNNLHNRRSLIRLARQRLSSLVALRSTVSHIEQWARQNTLNTANIDALKSIARFTGEQNKDIHAFFSTLNSPSFNLDNKYLDSFIGPVLNAIPTFVDIKDRICPVLHAIAQLDAYLSIATLYKEHESKPQVYSRAQYATKKHGPVFSAVNFWHPFFQQSVQYPARSLWGSFF